MMDIKGMKIQDVLLRVFLVVSLFFPAFYSIFDADYLAEYYVGFSVAYLILTLYLVYQTIRLRTLPKDRLFWGLLGIVVLYNGLSLYFNMKYLHWYWEQLNNTVAFLFFIFLMGYGKQIRKELDGILPFFMKAFVLSNLFSILYFLAGYTSFVICNNHLIFYQLPDDYYEFRHYWLYSHKSDYSVMLVAFLAVVLCYRKRFQKKQYFWISLAVLGAALVTTHSWTGYLAGMILIGTAILDCIELKKIFQSPRGKVVIGALGVAAVAVLGLLLRQRNIFTLGDRLPIWKAIVTILKERPQGLGLLFGEYPINIRPYWDVTNAHNVFLNQMLRFSVPVGIVFTVLILVIAGYCVYKSRTWLSAGFWAAILFLLNMDYSLLSYEVAMVLFCAYLVCIFPGVVQKNEGTGEKS